MHCALSAVVIIHCTGVKVCDGLIDCMYQVNNSSKVLALILHPSLWQVYKAYELVSVEE
jgi:hypothetical protein